MTIKPESILHSKVALPTEGNDEYYQLIETSNEITREYNEIQLKLISLQLPRILLWGYKAKLREIGRQTAKLQSKWSDWNSTISRFCVKPKYLFDQDTKNDVAFIHFTMVLLERARFVQGCIVQGVENYNKRFNEFENKRNFFISTSSWVLTFLGLIASLMGLFP